MWATNKIVATVLSSSMSMCLFVLLVQGQKKGGRLATVYAEKLIRQKDAMRANWAEGQTLKNCRSMHTLAAVTSSSTVSVCKTQSRHVYKVEICTKVLKAGKIHLNTASLGYLHLCMAKEVQKGGPHKYEHRSSGMVHT